MRRLLLPLLCLALIHVAPALAEDALIGENSSARAPFDQVAAVGLQVEGPAKAWEVIAVEPGSAAGRAGFQTGDRIVRVAGRSPTGEYAEAITTALDSARTAAQDSADLEVQIKRDGKKQTIALTLPLHEIDVLVATTNALDYLSDEVQDDPKLEKTRPRAFYAPIIYAPLSGLAFLSGGSTRSTGRHSAALRTLLAYVMEHGGRRKAAQDAINKAVGGNICSLTHNAGYSAMFLAQLIDSEGREDAATPLQFSHAEIREKLRACCKALEKIQLENGGWQHGSGGANMLGYTHLMAATVTAMNGLAMAKQVGVDESDTAIERGLAYIRKATKDGRVGYAVGNRGSFSAGRNAGVFQLMVRLGLQEDDLVEPMKAMLITNIDKAGTGHGSPVWHLFYVGLAAADIGPDASARFDALYRGFLLRGQADDGSILAPEAAGTKPGTGEENRVWGTLYTTPLIVLALRAPYRRHLLLYDFAKQSD